MSVYPIVSCDGAWGGGRFPCQCFLPLPHVVPVDDSVLAVALARIAAREQGWSRTLAGGDLCPAHTRHARAAQLRAAQGPVPLDVEANILRDLGQAPACPPTP